MAALQDRLDNAYRELRDLGYEEAVFDFDFVPELAAEVAPGRAEVIVTNTENTMHRMYDTGRESSWPTEFCDDVRAGVFGPPPKGVPIA